MAPFILGRSEAKSEGFLFGEFYGCMLVLGGVWWFYGGINGRYSSGFGCLLVILYWFIGNVIVFGDFVAISWW